MRPEHTEFRSANTSPTMGVDVGGTRFAYREFGPSTGVPVVFLHHFTAVIDDWDPRVIDGIASERRVITFDNRGVGGTEGRTPTTVSAMADDAIAFIRALGLEQVDLMGFSLGGFIAQAIVTKQPTLVRRIILAGTGPAGGDGVGKLSRRLLGDTMHGLLTRNDPKPYLFFTRTANGKAAATAYMDRLAGTLPRPREAHLASRSCRAVPRDSPLGRSSPHGSGLDRASRARRQR